MLNLDEIKLHLRIDHAEEDALLTDLLHTAVVAIADYLNLLETDPLLMDARPPLKSAALLLIGDLYLNREAQSDKPLHLNQAYERLLAPYRAYA